MTLWKCCTQYASKFGKLSSGHRTGKVSVQSNSKECSNYCKITPTSHASKAMLKILQARLQQYMNCGLSDVQAEFRKGRGTRDQIAKSAGSLKKQESYSKTPTSLLLTMPKPLTVWITINCGKFWKRWEYQTTWPGSWEICMQVEKQQFELDIEQTGSKLGKEEVKTVYCHHAYLTYMQSTSCEKLCWMKHKLESRFLGEISITSDMQMTPSLWQKVKNY